MSKCEIASCEKVAVSHGLCGMHRLRFVRHGDVNASRPAGWGSGENHPLYYRWGSMRRTSRLAGGHDPAWDNFWTFVADVSPQPSKVHRLYRIDDNKPFGPNNFRWREPLGLSQEDRKAKNAYMREWNRQRPHLSKALYLKRHYGVTIEWYESKLTEQDGVCSICKKPERRLDKRSGKPFLLAVDHNHATGTPRALLCSFCNHGLGNFCDDVELMRAAIAYLERHSVDAPTK